MIIVESVDKVECAWDTLSEVLLTIKQKPTRYSVTKKDSLFRENKELQSQMCRHRNPPAWRRKQEAGSPCTEGKRKLRGGAVATIELCCDHRVLPAGLS